MTRRNRLTAIMLIGLLSAMLLLTAVNPAQAGCNIVNNSTPAWRSPTLAGLWNAVMHAWMAAHPGNVIWNNLFDKVTNSHRFEIIRGTTPVTPNPVFAGGDDGFISRSRQ